MSCSRKKEIIELQQMASSLSEDSEVSSSSSSSANDEVIVIDVNDRSSTSSSSESSEENSASVSDEENEIENIFQMIEDINAQDLEDSASDETAPLIVHETSESIAQVTRTNKKPKHVHQLLFQINEVIQILESDPSRQKTKEKLQNAYLSTAFATACALLIPGTLWGTRALLENYHFSNIPLSEQKWQMDQYNEQHPGATHFNNPYYDEFQSMNLKFTAGNVGVTTLTGLLFAIGACNLCVKISQRRERNNSLHGMEEANVIKILTLRNKLDLDYNITPADMLKKLMELKKIIIDTYSKSHRFFQSSFEKYGEEFGISSSVPNELVTRVTDLMLQNTLKRK